MNSLSCWINHKADRTRSWDPWGRTQPKTWCHRCRRDRIDWGRIIVGTAKTILGVVALAAILTVGIWAK